MPGAMQRLHEIPELVDGGERIAARAVAGVRREEGDRANTPSN